MLRTPEEELLPEDPEFPDPPDDSDEELTVCCPDPITAARRLCGCGGQPYL